MSIAPSEMPFHVPEEPIRKFGSTDSSFELAPSPIGPDQLVLGHELPVQQERAGLVAAQAHRVPLLGLGLDLVVVDDEHRQVRVVAVVVGRGRLQDVEVGEAGRGRPRGLLQHLEAAVDAARAGGDRVPEVRAGLGVGVGERADQALAHLLQVLLDRVVGGAQLERLDGADVHDVAHGAGGVAVAGDRLGDVAAYMTWFWPRPPHSLGSIRPEEAVRGERLEALAREGQRAVVLGRQRPDGLLADLPQPLQQRQAAPREEPVRVEHRVEPVHGRLGCDRCHTRSSFVVALARHILLAALRPGLWRVVHVPAGAASAPTHSPGRDVELHASDAGRPASGPTADHAASSGVDAPTHVRIFRYVGSEHIRALHRDAASVSDHQHRLLDARPRPRAARDRRPRLRRHRLPRLLHLPGRRRTGRSCCARCPIPTARWSIGCGSSAARAWPAGWPSTTSPCS